MATEGINLTPDFAALFARFNTEARQRAQFLQNDLPDMTPGIEEQVLRTIQTLVAPIGICAQSATTLTDLGKLRDMLAYVLDQVVKHADCGCVAWLPASGSVNGDSTTMKDAEGVFAIIAEERLTRDLFMELDQRPGAYDGPDYLQWFWKLRRVRNTRGRELWAELEQNEAA